MWTVCSAGVAAFGTGSAQRLVEIRSGVRMARAIENRELL
jgi:hypothetical protein